jgi:hypothetical protein
MKHRILVLAALALIFAAFGVFQPKPADRVSATDVNLNSWRETTQVVLKLGNTSPGAVHPWAIHLGQCGADAGVFGALDNYSPLRIGSDGAGTSSATVAPNTLITANYFVSVQASPVKRTLTVACGNLAAPTT